MTRTGSIGSAVGPAVINTRLPSKVLGWKNAISSATSCRGSSMRPSPVSPQAWDPDPGPRIITPSSISCSTLRCVGGADHISRFMAGATSRGQLRARHSVDSRSLAWPWTSLAMKSAEAGATSTASAPRVRSICAMLLGMRASHWSMNTGRPDSACMVVGVMKWVAASVMTTSTVAPCSTSRRTRSADL